MREGIRDYVICYVNGRIDIGVLDRKMNDRYKEGWRLVSVVREGPSTWTLFWERKKRCGKNV